jgi:hypothetical protein
MRVFKKYVKELHTKDWTEKQGSFDPINRMITLSAITLSSFHCTLDAPYWDHFGPDHN